ncbi:hypothetical protein Plec18167_002831 [Paecilomyces lecythidis]|uniref:Uncharacterized protein n=1 Tax=Paecilomyces lecythidis TaxID=3004212 RepID=A0ABR3Y2B1_9EURO
MHTTPESGEYEGLISAGGRYYFTNEMTSSIYEIIKPTTLDQILKKISDKKEWSISMRELEQVETQEDLDRAKENEKRDRAFMEKMQSPEYRDSVLKMDWAKKGEK